ncbi:acetyl-CoA carboxylase biotin carboxyl carrier protein [Rahnella aceris]|jgi:acetyl-CoA carboxylase biotin carboxyl carrier protein|uniref:acetyl-CoA carboxylase biotin carboxyl carrier protein n=1 Tax=Rahnella sp. (strain Y9602) TaxID=2703885 RepID=UPI0014232DE0|nr:biotin/lipoyl-containing protein [Rahnella aceris]NIA88342.1 acetyl-CoA carboxylase biotin carboxyl carrier protein subunit [Rahnella aceris]
MEKKAPALSELRDIARKMRKSGLSQIELSGNGFRVSMKYAPVSPAILPCRMPDETPALPALTAPDAVCAPFPGIVLLQHPLNKIPFTQPGEKVGKDALLGLLKVGVIYLPLRSPVQGVVASLSVEDGDCVEYGAEIFTLRREELAA